MTQATTCDAPRASEGWTRAAGRFLSRLGSALAGVVDVLLVWQGRVAGRRHLLELDDRLLDDMGIDRVAAEAEAAKPFWRA